MTDYLVFTLSATIGSMGDLAGHERRGSRLWPGRSALTGLLGAALGLERQSESLAELDTLGMAVADFSPYDTTFRDFHTFETIPSAKVKPNSRPEALKEAGRGSETTLTSRDYRTNCLFGITLWNGDLENLCRHLIEPVFQLYFGRKSCPLSMPLCPDIVSANSAEEALSHLKLPIWISKAKATRLITDATEDDNHIEIRHDRAIDRGHWHFEPRRVALRNVNIELEDDTMYLSRITLSRHPSVQALDSLLNPSDNGARTDAHHRLLWSLFADAPGRTRDFIWREERKGEFLVLSRREPQPGDLFSRIESKPFAPQLREGRFSVCSSCQCNADQT